MDKEARSASSSLVILEHADLAAGKDLTEDLKRAFGPSGLGVLAVRGIPAFTEQYRRTLKLAHSVAHLPEKAKAQLEDEASMYNSGWSFGREKLGDKPDTSKGSFQFNPLHDEPGTDELRTKYPYFLPKNRWPSEVADLEPACKKLGCTMHEEAVLLAAQIDALCKKELCGRYPHPSMDDLKTTLSGTMKCKGRLLYYYPVEGPVSEDSWFGWHNDSGFITALTPDMFVDDTTGEEMDNPDPRGGLWVVDRTGGSTKVDIPKDCLGLQCGECLQVITGGLLVATPHCVRAPESPPGVRAGRVTCPCFVDTGPEFPMLMPLHTTRAQVVDAAIDSKVPPLKDRWLEDGVSFAKFLGDSFKRYYEWGSAGSGVDSNTKDEANDNPSKKAKLGC
jgi:isopenicillin N synthase-like dioxygenase